MLDGQHVRLRDFDICLLDKNTDKVIVGIFEKGAVCGDYELRRYTKRV